MALILVPAVAIADESDRFEPLFDGLTLAGWWGATERFEVTDGKIVAKPGGRGELYTDKTYGDFELCFDFRLAAGANSGIALRATGTGDPAYTGIECQILDNTAEKYASLQPYQYHGSLYGIAPAKQGRLRPPGAWNTQAISCRGRLVRVVLNDAVILEVDLDEVASGGLTLDGKPHPGLLRQSGHIGLLAHTGRVEFRNLRIRPLLASSRGEHQLRETPRATVGDTE
ncbi:MAG: DUF1080 domain-containing protein [Planctomycetota bacterium]